MRAWIHAGLATLALAGAVHYAIVLALPGLIMDRAIARMGEAGMNRIQHAPRATHDSRAVVRPSPDLLYSFCPYDLSEGVLAVRAKVPQGTYWSVAVYDGNTDNFFVVNDRQAGGDTVAFELVTEDREYSAAPGRPVIVSPSTRGVVLFRTLIADDGRLGELDEARREAECTIVAMPGAGSG